MLKGIFIGLREENVQRGRRKERMWRAILS
jgi:hypothetical protein